MTTESYNTFTATYSPEDNKLRLYAAKRLEPELYQKVKSLGFIWAPKQDLFVAPMWTPCRYDFLIELCGEVGDEDTSLVDRAEERADRFETYQEKRAREAGQAVKAVQAITENIPLGQPILIGHHSERRARKDAERIENGMQRAVKLWDTSEYWKSRAAGALSHAKYKDKPEVRARRIKKLEAEKRKHERNIKEAENKLAMWNIKDMTPEKAEIIAGHCWGLTLPLKEGDKTDQKPTAYDVLRLDPYSDKYAPRTIQEVIDAANIAYPRSIAHQRRWIEHYQNRITYETLMLNEQGASALIEKKPRPKQKPLCNYDGEITLKTYGRDVETQTMHHMTKAEYMALYENYRGTRFAADGSHRVRVAIIPREDGSRFCGGRLVPVFLTDTKTTRPEVA